MLEFKNIFPSEIIKEGYRLPELPENIRSIYISGAEYKGGATEMFAYLGVPKQKCGSCPAIILIHGGDGRAYHEWVAEWVERGFVALAIDNNSRHQTAEGVVHNDLGGPSAWCPWAEELSDKENTWSYISVKTLLMAGEMLAGMEEVDPERIYSYGISWGGYLSYLMLSASKRIKMGAVAYTTAYMHEMPLWIESGFDRAKCGDGRLALWIDEYDAKNYIPKIKMPVILARGMEDKCFPPKSINKTLDLFGDGIVTMANIKKYIHGHINGRKMVDVNGRICDDAYGDAERCGERKFTVAYTTAHGYDPEKDWLEYEISKDERERGIKPDGAVSWYYNEYSERGYTKSSRIFGEDEY